MAKTRSDLSEKPLNSNGLVKMAMNAIKRSLWLRWKPRIEKLKEGKVRVKVGKFKNGNDRYKLHWTCENCNELVPTVEIDHIEPSIDPKTGFVDLETWISRLLVSKNKLQRLCISCHDDKTFRETGVRAEERRKRDVRTGGRKRKGAKTPAKTST